MSEHSPAFDSALPDAVTHSPRVLVVLAIVWAVPLTAIAFGSRTIAMLTLVLLGGSVGLAALVAFARQQLLPILLPAFIALTYVSIDKYFWAREYIGGWGGVRIAAADLVFVILATVAAVGWLLGRIRSSLPASVFALAGLMLLHYCISALIAPHPELSAFEILANIHAFTIAVVVAMLIRRRHIPPVVATIAIMVVIEVGIGALQAATGRTIAPDWVRGSSEILVEELVTGATLLRPSGLFDHPIIYANFFTLTLPLLAAGAITARSRRLRIVSAVAAAAGFAGLVQTLSRGAWISTAFAAAILVALAIRYRMLDRPTIRFIKRGVIAVTIVAAAFSPVIYERVTQSNPENVTSRFELNEIAISMIRAHPMQGVGLNNFLSVMEHYDPRDVMSYAPGAVHNIYLLEASETGIPGLVLFLGLLAATTIAALRRLRVVDDVEVRWMACALLASWGGFWLSQLADFSYRIEPLHSIVWMNIGLMFGLLADTSPGVPGRSVSADREGRGPTERLE